MTDPTPEDDYPGYEDHEDRPWADEPEEAEEWQPGQCDNCIGMKPDEFKAAMASAIVPVCACRIGQGAPPGLCRCGRPADVPERYAGGTGFHQ